MGNEVSISILRDLIGKSQQDSNSKPANKVKPTPEDRSEVGQEKPETINFSRQDLEQAVDKLNEYITSVDRSLRFSVAESSGDTIITVVDSQTEEVIRQIPSEDTLKLANILQDTLGGLVNEEA